MKKKDRLFGEPAMMDVIIRVERMIIWKKASRKNTIVIINVMIWKVEKERKTLKFREKENSLKNS